MTPMELKDELSRLIDAEIMDPLMIMGESGIGKTSIVRQLFESRGMQVHDVRWGQLTPVDARGVPVPDRESKMTEFYSPSFWPRKGPGVIFLDEFNMASTSMMGLGQQLILDRQFGDYKVPDGVRVWAAGNRKIDRAAVNEIPAPVTNRVAHYEVEHDLDSFQIWAVPKGVDPRIMGFLKFRPQLLHKFNPDSKNLAWPSPRTWEMADRRLKARMSIAPVVGHEVSDEFEAHSRLVAQLPDLELVHQGRGKNVPFPEEPSMRYACIANFQAASMTSVEKFRNCLLWLIEKSDLQAEWIKSFVTDTVAIVSKNEKGGAQRYFAAIDKMPEVMRFIDDFMRGA